MEDFILANLLFQAGASTALLVLAAVSAARQLHRRIAVPAYRVESAVSNQVVELPSARVVRVVPEAAIQTRSEAA